MLLPIDASYDVSTLYHQMYDPWSRDSGVRVRIKALDNGLVSVCGPDNVTFLIKAGQEIVCDLHINPEVRAAATFAMYRLTKREPEPKRE